MIKNFFKLPAGNKPGRLKGSLTNSVVRSLLIFSLFPLALMAGAAYMRTYNLLQDQVLNQSEQLMSSQLDAIQVDIQRKQERLAHLTDESGERILIELALNADNRSPEFEEIKATILKDLAAPAEGTTIPTFDHFFIMDPAGTIIMSTHPDWQGLTLSGTEILNNSSARNGSILLHGMPPLYDTETVLFTTRDYPTSDESILCVLVGVNESTNLLILLKPLQAFKTFGNSFLILPDSQYVSVDFQEGKFSLINPPVETRENLTPTLELLKASGNSRPIKKDIVSGNGESVPAQLQWFAAAQTGVVLELEKQITYGAANRLIPFTVILIILILIAAGLVLLISMNRVLQPIRELSATAQGFVNGDWSRRAQVSTRDEVGELAGSFNHLADQLSQLHHSMEQKVEERARQIRAASEATQNITTSSRLDDLVGKTVQALVDQFGFFQSSVFMTDQSGKFLQFKDGRGEATTFLVENKSMIEVGSNSVIGWVSQNNLPRVASDVMDDSLHLKNELLPQTRSEAAVPISLGNTMLGVLDVQSTQPDAFNSEALDTLQTLAAQIAAAIQTVALSESSQVNIEELARIYQSSRLIVKAANDEEVYQSSSAILKDAPYSTWILRLRGSNLEPFSATEPPGESILDRLPSAREVDPKQLETYLKGGPRVALSVNEIPNALREFIPPSEFTSLGILPVWRNHKLVAIVMLGSLRQILNEGLLQPYINLAEFISITLEKVNIWRQTEKHLREAESLASISEAISTTSDLSGFFTALHEKVRQVIGDYSFMVALYDEKNDTISVPYSYENGQFLEIEPFPLGEGLSSILIRSQKSLLLVENTERRSAELGAKIQGKSAKSWMGVPLMVQNRAMGALILQDTEQEFSFDDEDLLFFSTLAVQVAGVVNNVRLLEETNRRAIQLESAAIIARDISGSLNLDELLIKAVNLIREQFDFYHAAVFLHDLAGEYAVIREATGEAGTQMKRQGYKINVGSKSIVGFVTRHGDQLIVNDTIHDDTYSANPLLPETRSEAAFALKVGERILGALDVQSTTPYAFNQDNLRSLQILADQLAIAVVNTELFAETQEHLSQHRLLHHITTTVASGTTLEEAMESAVNGLQVTLGGDRIIIFLLEQDNQQLGVKAGIGYSDDVTRIKVPVGSGVVGWVAAQKKSLRIGDVRKDARYSQLSPNTRSEMAIPLIYRNELLGVLNVESELLDAYTENDEEMLGTLAGSLAAIIANARLLEQIRQQAERERLVYEITSKIRRSSDIQSILTTTASELTRVTGSKRTKIEITPLDTTQTGSP